MSEIVKRTQILKYKKSGNLICVLSGPWSKHIEKIIILEISSDLQNVVKPRTQKYLNYNLIEYTSYFLEVLAITEKSKWSENLKDIRVIRTISYDDIDKEKWRETELLEDLPVGPYHEIMPEERIWAGEREGNLGAGIALLGFVIFLFFITYRLFVAENTIFSIIFAVGSLFSSYWLITFSWELPRSCSKEKLDQLKEYKSFLINSIDDQTRKSRTTVEKMLEDFSAWESLSPSNFEKALLLFLKKEDYDLKTTKTTGDGGVDLYGFDPYGQRIIVQAKRYSSKVGVSVVREMIGVRKTHTDNPITMVFSLHGFTNGAIDLAEKEDIILRNIRDELFNSKNILNDPDEKNENIETDTELKANLRNCAFCNREIEPSNKSNYCDKMCENNDNYDKEHHRKLKLKEKKKKNFKFWEN
jgi:restriction system protein